MDIYVYILVEYGNTTSDLNGYDFIITEILVGEISMNNKLMLSHI